MHPVTGEDLWRRRLSLDGQFVERFVLAWGGRLVLFAESPARMLTVSTMTGEVSEPIPLPGDRLPHEPQLLPSGRVLVPVQREVREQGRGARNWVYELLLADPALPPEEAVLESYRERGQSTRPFFMRTLHVGTRYLVIHDERGAAVVLQRDDLRVHRRIDKLDLGKPGKQGTYLAASGLIGERLIVVTAKGRRVPAQLAAFSLPDLEREYMVPAADTAREHVELVELSPGLIVLSLGPVGAAPRVSHAGRVRLFDVHGRAIQDVGPSSATDRLLHAQAQNGSLFLVTRSSIDVFGAK